MKILSYFIVFGCILAVYSCRPVDENEPSTPKCTFTSADKVTMLNQKWMNTFTQIDTYNTAGTSKTTSTIYPVGYFALTSNKKYDIISDNVPLNGNWEININCQLVLDSATTLQRNFDVIALSADSLTIRRKQDNVVYTQHYRIFTCPSAVALQNTWDNAVFRTDYYLNDGKTISRSDYATTPGYFKMNADASYNVVSGSDTRSGKWFINSVGCKLVLDQNTSIERSFNVFKITTDSLVIFRNDATINGALTQHYKKH